MSIEDFLTDYVDRPALAGALKVSTRTISRYESRPDGIPSILIGGRKLYRLDSVRKWIEARERYPNKRRA